MLITTNLIGFGSKVAPAEILGLRYGGGVANPSGASTDTLTFANVPLGTDATNRWTAVLLTGFGFPSEIPVDVTIGGIPAGQIEGALDNLAHAQIWLALGETAGLGPTANVVVTYSGTLAASVSLYKCNAWGLYVPEEQVPQPIDSFSDTTLSGNTLGGSLAVSSSNGIGMVIAGAYNGSGGSTWSGLTENDDTGSVCAAASATDLADTGAHAVSLTFSSPPSDTALACASFGAGILGP